MAHDDLAAEHAHQLMASYLEVLDGAVSPVADCTERFRRMFANCGSVLSPAEVEQAVQCYRRAYEAHRHAVPGVIPLLTYLKPRLRAAWCPTDWRRPSITTEITDLDPLEDSLIAFFPAQQGRFSSRRQPGNV